jgi:hypothetical protein
MADAHHVISPDQVSGLIPDEAQPGDADVHAESIVGVRFRGSSRVSFFKVGDPEIQVGTWIAVATSGGEQTARVVIAPHQMVLSKLPDPLSPIARVLDTEPIDFRDEPQALNSGEPAIDAEMSKLDPVDGARLIGGLGKGNHPAVATSPASMESNTWIGIDGTGGTRPSRDVASRLYDLSRENRQYREARQSMPALGQRVSTGEGEGTIVSLQVFKQLVTVRYDGSGREEIHPVADIVYRTR